MTVLNLARERRIRARVGELRDLLDADPELAERTDAMLAGDLPCPDLEDMMSKDLATSLRLPPGALEDADALVPALSQVPEIRAGREVSRSYVLRLAILKGLEVLKAEHKVKQRRSRKG